MNVKLEYEESKFIEFDAGRITYFFGANHEMKWKLYRGLKRFSTGKSLSDLEENIYGDDGINICIDDRMMKSRELPIYFLDCRASFLEQFQLLKGSLMQEYLEGFEGDFETNKRIEKINDGLLNLEILLQKTVQSEFQHIVPMIREMNYGDIKKYLLELAFFEEETLYPVEMMDIGKLIDEYCQLLKMQLEKTQLESWVWISNPNSFIAKSKFCDFIDRLKCIGDSTGLLKIFILSEDYLSLPYSYDDTSSTIVFYEEYQQIPEFSFLKESIQRNYPDESFGSDELLLDSFYRILPYIGWDESIQGKIYLKSKDMVLLKVVSQLLGSKISYDFASTEGKISKLEQIFLNN